MKFHSLSFALGLLFGGLGIFLFRNDSGDGDREDKRRVEEQVQRSGRSPGGGGSERSGVSSEGRNPATGSEGDLMFALEKKEAFSFQRKNPMSLSGKKKFPAVSPSPHSKMSARVAPDLVSKQSSTRNSRPTSEPITGELT